MTFASPLRAALFFVALACASGCPGPAETTEPTTLRPLAVPASDRARDDALLRTGERIYRALAQGRPDSLLVDDDGLRRLVTDDAATRYSAVRMGISVRLAVDPAEFAAVPGVRAARADGNAVTLEVEGALSEVFRVAARHEVRDFVTREADLEDVFLAYYGGDAV